MKGKAAWLDVLKESLEAETTDTRRRDAPAPLARVDKVSESLIRPTDNTDKSPHESRIRPLTPVAEPCAALGPEGRKLEASGWKPKERCGKTIWASPENGFWYSEEMALLRLRQTEERREVLGEA